MARRRTTPDALREAVERTVQATVGSAQQTRDRAQGAVDDLVKGAEAGLTRSREAVRDVIDDRRPLTHEDLKELKAELRAIGRRLDKIEERLPAKRRQARAKGSSKSKSR
jgi:polyhydroxyalkanoate synthesis regulator phasin